MTAFTLNNALSQEAWSAKYASEYIRTSGFMPYMKGGSNAVINVNRDLTKTPGDVVNMPYVRALTGAGVTGSTQLRGSEEALGNYTVEIRVTQLRNAVLVPESEMYKTDLNLANIASERLRSWSASFLRNDLCTALGSIPIDAGTTSGTQNPDTTKAYAAASEAEKDAWNAANADRLVFGTATTTPTGDNSVDLATIAAGEKLSATVLDRAVDLFEATSSFKLNPFMSDDTAGREWKVLFVGTAGFNQLRADADIKASNQQAWTRDEMKNPIFQGGDIYWNGVIIRKIPELTAIGAVGTAGASVSAAYLCGANALGVAWGATPEARSEIDDYGEQRGVAIREVRGVKKMSAAIHDLGMATVFFATV